MEIMNVSSALVPLRTRENNVAITDETALEKLRREREAHRHRQIWTKDAHGGPYKKVNEGKGYDPLIEHPDGTKRQVELGYERAETGPTTNFVGNHMTQGAIDLVQAELEKKPQPLALVHRPEKILSEGTISAPLLLEPTGPVSLAQLRLAVKSFKNGAPLLTSFAPDNAPDCAVTDLDTEENYTDVDEVLKVAEEALIVGQYDVALKYLEGASPIHMMDSSSWSSLCRMRAVCHRELGNLKEALEDMNCALETTSIDDSDEKSVVTMLVDKAGLCEGMEKWEEALEAWECVARLAPGRREAFLAVKRLRRMLSGIL